ncbi:hypothetical protein Pint_30668 [Pistacia integerrima]|uniref:Uncharacterized protein n=1 Tax=Pistacia integerrima TaxID=434235 RepID=A0ACC0WZS9_9ROSI|nr:hypothetical protein Pint_30668 [Pistacia integerrima]
MEIINRRCLLWLFMGSLLLLNCSAKADKGFPPPLKNVNLAPYQKWINAYKCMQNHSDVCQSKNVLNMSGIVDVSQNELPNYCEAGGCGDHIKDILDCIHLVKNDFVFYNGAILDIIRGNITDGCNNSHVYYLLVLDMAAFSTAKYHKSGSTRRNIPLLLTLVLIIVFII